MLSEHIFHILGRTFTITSTEQFFVIIALTVFVTAWALQQFRRRRVVVLHGSAVTDQVLYDLSRIADALERIANRPMDQIIATQSRPAEESTGRIPYSMFGR